MNARTRYVVIVAVLVLAVGLGTGLVAYYVGLPRLQQHAGPAELELVPKSASVVAYANVREVMTSELHQKLQRAASGRENERRQFEDATGINVETDIDRVVGCLDQQTAASAPANGLLLATGRFNEAKIESLMRDHGARVDTYKGRRIVSTEAGPRHEAMAIAFLEPGLVGVGGERLLHAAIDLQHGGDNITKNDDVMRLVRSLDRSDAWAVGRFDTLRSTATLPPAVAERLPAITWFSISGRINDGVQGVIRAQARDEDSAKNLRDVVRGFIALARLQAGANPQFQAMIQSLDISGDQNDVALTFSVPGAVFDTIGALSQPGSPRSAR